VQSATARRWGPHLGFAGVGDDPCDDRAGGRALGEDGGVLDCSAARRMGPREPRDDRANGLVVDAQILVEAVKAVARYTGFSTMTCILASPGEAQATR
jgi:hypothetical protein